MAHASQVPECGQETAGNQTATQNTQGHAAPRNGAKQQGRTRRASFFTCASSPRFSQRKPQHRSRYQY